MAGNALQVERDRPAGDGAEYLQCQHAGLYRRAGESGPRPRQQYGGLLLGTGVLVQSITEKVDNFLQTRLQNALAISPAPTACRETMPNWRQIVGALNSSNLGTSMDNFFSSIQNVLNQPSDASVRNLAAVAGQTLTSNINQMASQTEALRSDINTDVSNLAPSINNLTSQIGAAEPADRQHHRRRHLRQRRRRLERPAPAGPAKPFPVDRHPRRSRSRTGRSRSMSAATYLVDEGTVQKVIQTSRSDGGQTVTDLRIQGTNTLLNPTSGELQGCWPPATAMLHASSTT